MNNTKSEYNYDLKYKIDNTMDLTTAIEYTILNYMHLQLGWTVEDCRKRVGVESNREIANGTFNYLEKTGWEIKGEKIIDIGSGQGGAVLEALYRGADAYGIEPGEEFAKLSKMRLRYACFDENRILKVTGEKLPFDNNTFDYAISLQVLEHVKNPEKIINEIFRVLKPGGKCFISCENYLSFREQHYRIPWLPLLPKFLGSIFLKIKGRNPYFLNNYVFYTTYPQIWRLVKKTGFNNITYNQSLAKLLMDRKISSKLKSIIFNIINLFPINVTKQILTLTFHTRNFFKVGVRVLLEKPIY